MLFSELINGRFKAFARMNEESKTKNITTVKYIQNLASLAGVDVMSWDVKDIFGKSGNSLIEDKNEINRRFFEEIDRLAAAAPKQSSTVFDENFKAQLKAAETRYLATLLSEEQRKGDAQLREAQNYYTHHLNTVKRAAEHFAAVRRLSRQESNLEEQIRQINDGNFWAFSGITDGTKIEFVTKQLVRLVYKNATAGIDIDINMGKYKAVFNIASFELTVWGHDDNINARGHIHPHISSYGAVCWGSASSVASRALASCQLVEPMTLLATVLSNYNKESPYVGLEWFQEARGLPEEVDAQEELDEQAIAVRARMDQLDSRQLDVDRRRVNMTQLTNQVATQQAETTVSARTRTRNGVTVVTPS